MTSQLPLEVRFLRRYARQLHSAGVPAHQFERMMAAIADKLGFDCQVMSSPTAIFLSFHYQDDEDDQRPIPMQLERMNPPSINLGNAAKLYHLASGSARLADALVAIISYLISRAGGIEGREQALDFHDIGSQLY